MNKHTAKRIGLINPDDIKDYIGLSERSKEDRFRRGKPFVPGTGVTLSELAPKQLHNTETHPGGVLYIQTSLGGPDLKRTTVDVLDGYEIPHWMMRKAFEHLRDNDEKSFLTIEALRTKLRGEKVESIARRLFDIDRRTAYDRIDAGCRKMAEWLDREISRMAGEEVEVS